ncbi:hypothetical protein [Pseudomonas sp. ADAK18]|uniref:hypothetical protein n=1 Tax=Pseudomonas sp. ADAK18 TaxID=2730848 RepID=UPI001F3F3DAE|nr:hypothetical protein [Pseudomonas sp. ADAK18]
MNTLMSYLDNGVRAILVFSLAQAAKAVMVLGVRLYVRNLLSAVEMRFMLAFSSTLSNTSVRLLRPPRK